MHVLLIVDDKLSRALRPALEQGGHEVTVAPTASQALALAKKKPPGCVALRQPKTPDELQKFRESLQKKCPGSTFAIVPVKSEDTPETVVQNILEMQSAVEAAAGSAPAGPTVLLLDDRGIARKHLGSALAAEGWRVFEAGEVREAALKLIDGRVDCLLLTNLIAGQSSAGVIKSAMVIREAHPQPYSIVVLVDSEEGQGAAGAMRAGADDVIAKTLVAPVMNRRLQLSIRMQRLIRENRVMKERLAILDPEPEASPAGSSADPSAP